MSKNRNAVALGKLGGNAKTQAQRQARVRAAAAMRAKRWPVAPGKQPTRRTSKP